MQKKVSQKDLAKALGLSVSTVSLVVGASQTSLRDRLDKKTVERVLSKASEMGYVPNRAAQIVRSGKTNLIVLLNMSGYSEVMARHAYHIGREVSEAGFEFQNVDAYWSPGDGNRIIDYVISLHPMGVILIGVKQTDMHFERLVQAKIPMVTVDQILPEVPRVMFDIRSAFYQLTESVIRDGRKRIALFLHKGSSSYHPSREREIGFRKALADLDCAVPKALHVGETLPSTSPYRKGKNTESVQSFIFYDPHPWNFFDLFKNGREGAGWFQDFADAVLCVNDFYALGVLTWFLKNGISVPQQVALSGADNYSYTDQGAVSLTTVEQPGKPAAEAALQMLIPLIQKKQVKYTEETIACPIIWRESLPDFEKRIHNPKNLNSHTKLKLTNQT